MSETINREHFAFLRSYWEQIKLLPSKKQKYEMFEAIMSIQFFEKEINSISFSSQNQMLLWEGLKPILKQSQKGYLDKTGLSSPNPKQGSSEAPTQHKDKDKDKERREREYTSNNIYFSISGNELKKEVHSFINDTSIDARNKTAYKAKLRKQIEKEHPQTLEAFEEWYLNSKCEKLLDKYKGKKYQDQTIVSIHSYLDTPGFSDENKFILQMLDEHGKNNIRCYEDIRQIEHDLQVFV
jgi:hypothetical protein